MKKQSLKSLTYELESLLEIAKNEYLDAFWLDEERTILYKRGEIFFGVTLASGHDIKYNSFNYKESLSSVLFMSRELITYDNLIYLIDSFERKMAIARAEQELETQKSMARKADKVNGFIIKSKNSGNSVAALMSKVSESLRSKKV